MLRKASILAEAHFIGRLREILYKDNQTRAYFLKIHSRMSPSNTTTPAKAKSRALSPLNEKNLSATLAEH